MSQFAAAARRQYFSHKDQDPEDSILASYDAMFGFQRDCERSAGVFSRDWENIEELYTQADLRRLAQLPSQAEGEGLCASIAWALWDVYRRGVHHVGESGPMDRLATAVHAMKNANGLSSTVITTNYDLVAEAALTKAGIQFGYPGFDLQANTVIGRLQFVRHEPGWIARAGLVRVIKLHGSVNWFEVGTKWWCSRSIVPDSGHRAVTASALSQRAVREEARGCDMTVSTDAVKPAIIPPMLGKMSLGSVIAEQWRAAVEAVQQARYVVIVGYSFPETDAFMTRLLAEGLHRNDDMERLVIIDIASADEWQGKIARLFAPVFARRKLTHVRATAIDGIEKLYSRGLRGLSAGPGS